MNDAEKNPWIKVLYDCYKDLRDIVEDDPCDHSVGICWCSVKDHLDRAKIMLEKVGLK